jgi:hypothetical protein
MDKRAKIGIGIVVIAVVMLVLYYATKPTYNPNAYWCQSGTYKDGTPVLQADAQVGATVCGGGNVAYGCSPSGWVSKGPCVSGMKGY